MPLPISTVCLVLAAILVNLGTAFQVIGLVFGGLALLNEAIRAIVVRQPPNEYSIPAVPRERRVRNPLIPDGTDDGG